MASSKNLTSLDPGFLESTSKLEINEQGQVMNAIAQYTKDPATPSLQLERLSGKVGSKRLWSIRASIELRVLIAKQGPASVFLRAGHHDYIYQLAQRSDFVAPQDGNPQFVTLERKGVDLEPKPVENRKTSTPTKQEQPILRQWSNRDLEQAGFNVGEIDMLRKSTLDTLLDVWTDISEERLSLIMDLIEVQPADYLQGQLIDDPDDEYLYRAIIERGALGGLSSVLDDDEVQRLVAAPIEEWMIFLHPNQRELVERNFTGPARVRGSAGTGKSVVALHRAAALAKQFGSEQVGGDASPPILFTTYIKTLPPVFDGLFRQIPSSRPDCVEFVNIDRLANQICNKAQNQLDVDTDKVKSAFTKAFQAIVTPDTPLHTSGITKSYLLDEVAQVIKGRGLKSLGEYQRIERTGRGTGFGTHMRTQVWELYEAYQQELKKAKTYDFADRILVARDIALSQPAQYRAAIVDEVQDLTLVGLQLVRALVSDEDGVDKPNALFLAGDGGQRIYPGGFTLQEAGVDVRGRSAVLATNYRNSKNIIDVAMSCAGAVKVDDLGEKYDPAETHDSEAAQEDDTEQETDPGQETDTKYKRGEMAAKTLRDGMSPVLVQAEDEDAQADFIAQEVQRLAVSDAVAIGDIAVLVSINNQEKKVQRKLEQAGLRVLPIKSYTGRFSDEVKVGTLFRAKGLEFKIVFLYNISDGRFPKKQEENMSDEEYADHVALDMSRLYVAMTRARDQLYVLYSGEPSPLLESGLDKFEHRVHET